MSNCCDILQDEPQTIISDDNDQQKLINELRELMNECAQLKNLPKDDAYLMRFLSSCAMDVQAAFERMKYYYELLEEFPDWFQTAGPVSRKPLIEKDIRVMTQWHDRQGRPIYLVKIANMNPSTMSVVDVVSVDDIWMEFIANNKNLQEHGLSVIIDIKNFSLKLIKWMTPHNLRVGVKKLEAHPIKEFKFHVVNSSNLINIPIKILWPFLPEKIKNMIQFHFEDWDSLHKHISPEMLPQEYGGTLNTDFQDEYNNLLMRDNEIVQNFKSFRCY